MSGCSFPLRGGRCGLPPGGAASIAPTATPPRRLLLLATPRRARPIVHGAHRGRSLPPRAIAAVLEGDVLGRPDPRLEEDGRRGALFEGLYPRGAWCSAEALPPSRPNALAAAGSLARGPSPRSPRTSSPAPGSPLALGGICAALDESPLGRRRAVARAGRVDQGRRSRPRRGRGQGRDRGVRPGARFASRADHDVASLISRHAAPARFAGANGPGTRAPARAGRRRGRRVWPTSP